MPIDFIPDKKIDFTPDGPATATIDFVPDEPRPQLDMSELGWSAEGPGPQSVNVGPRTESMQPVEGQPIPTIPQDTGFGSIGAAPEPTMGEKVKRFFVGGGPKEARWTKSGRYEKIQQALSIPAQIFSKFAGGKSLFLDRMLWYGIGKARPDLTQGKTLHEAVESLEPNEKSGLRKMVNEVAEFMGSLQTAHKLLGTSGAKATKAGDVARIMQKFSQKAPAWMVRGAIEAVAGGIEKEKGVETVREAAKGAAVGGVEALAWSAVEVEGSKLFGAVWGGIKAKYPDFAQRVTSRYQSAKTGKRTVEATKNRQDAIRARKHFKKHGTIPDDLARKYGFGTAAEPRPTPIPAEQAKVKDFGKYPLGRPSAVTPPPGFELEKAPGLPQFAKTIPEGVQVAPAEVGPEGVKPLESQQRIKAIREAREKINNKSKAGDIEGLFDLQNDIADQKFDFNMKESGDATTIRLDEPSGRYVIISPSAKQKGRWQLTKFDKGGPFEDTVRDTKEEAIEVISGKKIGGLDWSDNDDYLVTDISKTQPPAAKPKHPQDMTPEEWAIEKAKRYPPAAKPKQAWEMTQEEYRIEMLKERAKHPTPAFSDAAKKALEGYFITKEKPLVKKGWREEFQRFDERHKSFIKEALSENKPVPLAVLEEYKSEQWAKDAIAKLEPKKGKISQKPITEKDLDIEHLKTPAIKRKMGATGLELYRFTLPNGRKFDVIRIGREWSIGGYRVDEVNWGKDKFHLVYNDTSRKKQIQKIIDAYNAGFFEAKPPSAKLEPSKEALKHDLTDREIELLTRIRDAGKPPANKIYNDLVDDLGLTKKEVSALRKKGLIDDAFPLVSITGRLKLQQAEGVDPFEGISEPSKEAPKSKPGFVAVPAALKDIAEITEAAVSPAESRFARLGLTGKKLVARAKKAHDQAKIRAGRSMELMHRTTKGLTSKEKKNLGYAVNYIAWEKDVRAKREKLRGYKLRTKPTSLKQRKAAATFLKLADYARSEYEKLGGEVKMGGIPWPQRFTKEGLKLYAEAMDAVDKSGNPNFKILRENALIKAMIEEGTAKDVGQAYKILKRQQDWIKRPLYAYMERNKEPLPSKYLEFDVDKIVDQDFWLKMYRHVEYARQFGVEHYRAAQYIKAIKDEHGEAIANSVQEWWDRLIDLPKQETKGQIVSRKLAFALGQYQALKLSPLTSIQNFFQRWLSAMEWGPIAVLRGQAKAWTRKGRIYARESGAIPFDPFEAGLMADLKTKESRAFARAWVEAIGMGVTERGNNYTAALTAARGITNDLEKLSKKSGPIGSLFKNLLSLGGDSKGAIKRRLQKHGVNWKKALKRGHLTLDELHLASLREAESKHFRTDFFTTPTWWQKSPWGRQWAKYKIPFAYNMMIKIWKLSAIEAAHGNFRPMLAFLLVATLTGEIYNLWRKVLLGEDRSDLPIVKRLWEDIIDGGAVGLFGGLVFGKDIVEKIWNTTFGVSGATLKRTVELVGRKIPEAPEHTGEHILRHIEQEIPTVKYINQATWQKEDHIRRFNRYKVREYEEELVKREGDLWYYYEDLYDAAIEGDRTKMVNAARKAIEHGATLDTLITAMTSRRPAKIAQVKRPKLITGLAEPQKEVLRKLEREHDIAVARVRVLAKGRWNEYVAGLIRQASSKKRPLGERQRAMQRLNNIGISKSQWDKYLREARK